MDYAVTVTLAAAPMIDECYSCSTRWNAQRTEIITASTSLFCN